MDLCLSSLLMLDSVSLRFRPKTNALIENGCALAASFEKASQSERDIVREAVHPALAKKLLGLTGFMAETAMNSSNAALIRSAILLHVIEDFRIDYRENYRYLVLVRYASIRVNADFKSTMMSVGHVASERVKQHFSKFLSRSDDLNRLESFGIRAEVVDGLFKFVPL